MLGWTTVKAEVFEGDELECELVEIDENLTNHDLTVLEQSIQLKRRNEILEEMGRRAESGGQPGNKNATKNEGVTVAHSYDPNIYMPGEYVEVCITHIMDGVNTSHTFSGYDILLSNGEKLEVKHSHYLIDQSRPGRKIGQWVFTRVDVNKDFDYLVCVCLPGRGFDWSKATIYKIPKDMIETQGESQRFVIRGNGVDFDDYIWKQVNNVQTPPKTTEDIAKEVGLSKRSTQRRTQIARDLSAEVIELIGDTPIADSTTQLLGLARMKPDEQIEVAKQAVANGKTVEQAKKEKKQEELKEKKKEQVTSLSELQPVIEQCDAIEWLVKQEKCDLLITDPPYMTDVENIEEFALNWLPVALDKVKNTGRAYICIGSYPRELKAYLNITPPSHLVLANILPWTYRNTLGPSPKLDYKNNLQAILYYRGIHVPELNCPVMVEQFNVQDISAPDGRNGTRFHKWQKPDKLGRPFVSHGSKEGDTVFDPFAGTGTFLIEVGKVGRIAMGCELDGEMLKISEDRGCKVVK